MQNHTIRNMALAVVAVAGTQFADAGTVFGLLSDGGVYEIDLATSAAPVRRTLLPYLGAGYQGLEIIPGTSKMYALNYARDLVEVDMRTWTTRSLGILTFPSGDFSAFTKDLSWNPATGTLETVCVTNNAPSIYRVDVTTMRLVRVGLVTGMNGISLGLAHDAAGRRVLSPQSPPVRIHDLVPGTNGSFNAVPRSGTLSGFDFRALSLDYAGSGKLYSSSSNAIVEVSTSGTTINVRALPFGTPLEDIAIVPAPASLCMLGALMITPRRRRR